MVSHSFSCDSLVGEILNKMMDDPANDLFGGYYPFLRRIVLPFVFIMIFLFMFDLSNESMTISAIITGLMLGPVLAIERMIVIYLLKQNNLKNGS